MPQNSLNIGENATANAEVAARMPLATFADAVKRAEERAGGRAALVRETGFSEANLRRWGDQGKYPGLELLLERRLPLAMLVDIFVLLGARHGVKVALELIGDETEGAGGMLQHAIRSAKHGLKMVEAAAQAERRGPIADNVGASNLQLLTLEQNRLVRQLSLAALTAVTGRR